MDHSPEGPEGGSGMGVIGSAFQAITGRTQRRDMTFQQMWETADYGPGFYDVGGENALRVIAVYAAVSQIADALSSLQMRTYRAERGQLVEIDPPQWLHQPDDRVSDFDWLHQGLSSVLLRGNAYARVFRDDRLQVREVEWQHPTQVSVDESSQWLPVYRVGGAELWNERTRFGGGLVHVPGFLLPGTVKGLGPVGLFRSWFEMSRNVGETARKWYGERAMPASILSSKAELKKGQASEVQEKINGEIEPGRVMVVDGANWAWTPVSLSPADMQFLNAIEASATQVAAIFRVEPEDVGGKSSSSLKYSTVEGNQRKFNLRTLMSWARRFEQGLRPLLENPETDVLRFDLDDLARPDAEAQARITAAELNAGTLTLAEARQMRGRTPLTDADISDWQAWFRAVKSFSAPSDDVAGLLDAITQLKGN